MTPSTLEHTFLTLWDALAVSYSEPAPEYRFHSTRRWRFDFAFPAEKVAVECDGGTFISGRHSRGAGQRQDAEKRNAAALSGWLVLTFTTDMLTEDPANCIQQVCVALDARRRQQRAALALVATCNQLQAVR